MKTGLVIGMMLILSINYILKEKKISIANSTMFSSDKVYAIKSLNKTFAENTSAIVK